MKNADDMLFERSLPAAPEAEKFVLGSVLAGHPIANVTGVLRANDFNLEKHRRIFAAMVHLEASGSHVDTVTLAHEIRRRGQIESVDGFSYLVSLDEGMPLLANLDAYVSIVRDKAVLRQAIAASQAAIEECLTAADPTPEILERAERTIVALATETRSASFRTPINGTGVAFFTLEMPDQAILIRMASARAQVDSLKVTQGHASQLETQSLSEAFTDLADEDLTRLWIDDSTGCTVPAMRAALRRLTSKHPIGLVVIDYLQLVETSGGSDRRYEQVSEISRGVKRLAREFKVPVVVLAQLNREMEKDSRKPRPSDLRDSGSIEQDADIILMPAKQGDQEDHSDTLMIDLIIAKQRNGPLGKVPLKFLKRYAKFIEPTSAQGARIA